MNCRVSKVTRVFGRAAIVIWATYSAVAQLPGSEASIDAGQTKSQGELTQKLDRMMLTLEAMQEQLRASQQEIEELRSEVKKATSKMDDGELSTPGHAAADLQSSVEQLKDDDQIVQAEVKQHEQTKVETFSKYPMRLNGMLMFSSFLTDGAVNEIDQPGVALPRDVYAAHGSLSATVSQTVLGLQATGPHLAGAASSADVNIDFFGGSPSAYYSTSAGLVRLRTAHAALDWRHNSLRMVLDKPLMSRAGPTSFLSLSESPLAWSGNLWIWSPQLIWNGRVNQRSGGLDLQAGLIDPPTPGFPGVGPRQPDAAERGRKPGYEARVGYTLSFESGELEIGGGGYYSRQSFPYSQHIDAWATTMDWRIAFLKRFELSGALYRGRAIGGLGGAFQDYVLNTGTNSYRGLNAEGGWSQMKWHIGRFIEANGAIGQANSFAHDLQFANPAGIGPYATLARNRTAFGNVIYRPNSYLVFSAEYRNISSWQLTGNPNKSQSLGLGAGYLF